MNNRDEDAAESLKNLSRNDLQKLLLHLSEQGWNYDFEKSGEHWANFEHPIKIWRTFCADLQCTCLSLSATEIKDLFLRVPDIHCWCSMNNW